MLPQASWTWHKLENPSACGGLGCAAGRWMTPDPSLKGWLLKDGGQLRHHAGSLCSPEQLPQHNPSQRWSQSIQCSSLFITYTSLKEITVLQPSKWSWLVANTVIEIQKKCKNGIWDISDQTNLNFVIVCFDTLVLFLPEVSRFIFLLCVSKPCFLLSLYHLPTLSCPADPTNMPGSNGAMATRWWLEGARLAPVGPDAFLHFPCSLMQHTPLKALYKVQRAWTTTTEVWVERSAAVINHLSINHCHPCCSGSLPASLKHLED